MTAYQLPAKKVLPGQASQQHLSRRTYKVAIAGSLLVVASATGFNAAMIAGFVAAPLALLAFVSAAGKWEGYTRKSIQQRKYPTKIILTKVR